MPARSSRSSSMPGILCPPACLSSGHSIKSSFPCNRVVSLPPPALFPLFHPGFLSFTPFYPVLLGVSLFFSVPPWVSMLIVFLSVFLGFSFFYSVLSITWSPPQVFTHWGNCQLANIPLIRKTNPQRYDSSDAFRGHITNMISDHTKAPGSRAWSSYSGQRLQF